MAAQLKTVMQRRAIWGNKIMKPILVALALGILLVLPSCVPLDPTPGGQVTEATTPLDENLVSTSTSPPPILIEPDDPIPQSEEVETDVMEPASTQTESNLSSKGPWLLYMGSSGLYGIDHDGQGKTKLIDETKSQSILLGPGSPTSGQVAVGLGDQSNFFADIKLYFLNLPDGELEEVTSLLPIELSEEFLDWETEEIHAVVISKPSWSPSGKQISFIGVIDGPSSDLYVYDLDSKRLTRLTSGSNEALHPYWTLDGSSIIHYEGENLLSMSEELPRRMVAIWAAKYDGSGVSKVLDLVQLNSQDPSLLTSLLGWSEDGALIIYQTKFDLESEELQESYRQIDLKGGSSSDVDDESIAMMTELDPMRELIFRPRTEVDVHSPDLTWIGTISDEKISLENSLTGESVEISKSPINVFIWKPDSSGFFVASNHTLFMAEFPEGELLRVDSSVSDFEDHFTWASYNPD